MESCFGKQAKVCWALGIDHVLTIPVDEKSAAQGCLKGQVILQWG